MIGSAKKLQEKTSIRYKRLGIAPDMTRKERKEKQKLREELKLKRYAAERGCMIKGYKLISHPWGR